MTDTLDPPTARDEVASYLDRYYAAMETNQPDNYAAYYADDIRLVFGNAPSITGRDAVVEAFHAALSRVRSLHHDLVNIWTQPGGIVIFESIGTWNLFDGRAVSVPACSVFTIRDGLFTDLRIYVDNEPVQGALNDQNSLTP